MPDVLNGSATPEDLVFQVLSGAMLFVVLTRFGLLMFAAMMTTGNLLSRIGGFSEPGYAMGAK